MIALILVDGNEGESKWFFEYLKGFLKNKVTLFTLAIRNHFID
jgi:hypothetical protein